MNRRFKMWLLVLALWMIPGLLTASFNAVLFPRVLEQGVLLYFSALTAYWLVWALFTPFIAYVARRFPFERGSVRASILPHVAAYLGCSFAYVAWYVFFARMLVPSTERTPELWVLIRGNAGSRIALGTILYVGIVAITLALDERARRRTRELQEARLQAQLGRAQLQALQMQLQPHFLFNTLHAISMLVQENPTAATRTITQLGDLLRKTLALADVPEVSLREELSLLQQYLDIELTRFSDHLTVTLDVAEALLSTPVPSFILQPIVENAVRHGISPRVEPGRITIRAFRETHELKLEVVDDGPGFDGAETRDAGIGLATTRERLNVLYGGGASLECSNVAGGGARVIVSIPLQHD